MDEFGCFYESESLNDAPLFEATTESAPICLKRPPKLRAPGRVIVIAEYRIPFPVSTWGNPKQATGPPEFWRIAA